ncbi:MAG: type II secretion system F family protein [Planctomycetaceae bacterium]|jgi:tight adherence protein C|nr:type II secretion system F family protein [Planctomycetaceae bacterium]
MFANLITAGAFLVIALFVFMMSEAFRNARLRARALADLDLGKTEGGGSSAKRHAPSAFRRAMAGVIPQFGSEVEKIEKDLKLAGYYRPWALVDYLSSRNSLIVMVLIGFFALAAFAPPGSKIGPTLIGAGLITAMLGYGLPRLMLSSQAKSRVDRIQRGLPDALDIVHMCLSGGLSLRDSFARVSQEIEFFHPEIAIEFEVIRRQSEADTMSKALRNFADRIDTPDVTALASLVTQADKLGTHVAEAVTEFAVGVRRSFQQNAEERANKTTIKLLFPVVLCLAPPIYILLMGPPLLQMRDFIKEGNQPGGILDSASMTEGAAALTPDVSGASDNN